MRFVERSGVLTAIEWNKAYVVGIMLLATAIGTTVMHVAIGPQPAWEEPWRIGLITLLGLFAILFAERRSFIVDTRKRLFTLKKKRGFSIREESVPFDQAERFEYLASRVGIFGSPSLHLAHEQGMLHIFGQGRDSMPLIGKDAERIATAAGLELKNRMS